MGKTDGLAKPVFAQTLPELLDRLAVGDLEDEVAKADATLEVEVVEVSQAKALNQKLHQRRLAFHGTFQRLLLEERKRWCCY